MLPALEELGIDRKTEITVSRCTTCSRRAWPSCRPSWTAFLARPGREA